MSIKKAESTLNGVTTKFQLYNEGMKLLVRTYGYSFFLNDIAYRYKLRQLTKKQAHDLRQVILNVHLEEEVQS